MNAIVAPISPTATLANVHPAKANPFGTDAIYKGYDLMVRKSATHIIKPAQVTGDTRAALVRAIGSPAVSFAASAADGSILITCPDGLPGALLGLAEPLGTGDDLATSQKLDQLERKLDRLIQDQNCAEQLSDRISALEFTLRESLDQGQDAPTLQQISDRIDAVLQTVAQIPAPPDLALVLAALQNVTEQITTLPRADALTGLEHGLETLVTRVG